MAPEPFSVSVSSLVQCKTLTQRWRWCYSSINRRTLIVIPLVFADSDVLFRFRLVLCCKVPALWVEHCLCVVDSSLRLSYPHSCHGYSPCRFLPHTTQVLFMSINHNYTFVLRLLSQIKPLAPCFRPQSTAGARLRAWRLIQLLLRRVSCIFCFLWDLDVLSFCSAINCKEVFDQVQKKGLDWLWIALLSK